MQGTNCAQRHTWLRICAVFVALSQACEAPLQMCQCAQLLLLTWWFSVLRRGCFHPHVHMLVTAGASPRWRLDRTATLPIPGPRSNSSPDTGILAAYRLNCLCSMVPPVI